MKKLILTILMCLFAVGASADTLNFQWEYGEIPPDFAGFKLYMSDTPDINPKAIDEYDVIPFIDQQTYYTSEQTFTPPDGAETVKYFVVTAYDDYENESGPSNEISHMFDKLAPGTVFNFSLTVGE